MRMRLMVCSDAVEVLAYAVYRGSKCKQTARYAIASIEHVKWVFAATLSLFLCLSLCFSLLLYRAVDARFLLAQKGSIGIGLELDIFFTHKMAVHGNVIRSLERSAIKGSFSVFRDHLVQAHADRDLMNHVCCTSHICCCRWFC